MPNPLSSDARKQRLVDQAYQHFNGAYNFAESL